MVIFSLSWFFILLGLIILTKQYSSNSSFYNKTTTGRIVFTDCLAVGTFDLDTHCKIDVQYTVDGTDFSKIFYVHPEDGYTNTQTLPIYYHQGNPRQSVIKKQHVFVETMFILLLCTWFLFGLAYLYLTPSSRK